MYSPQVLDHFEHPRNAGLVDDADASVQLENPACGDVLKLTIKVSGDRIACDSLSRERVRQLGGLRIGADRVSAGRDD